MKAFILALMIACLPVVAMAEETIEEVTVLEKDQLKLTAIDRWIVLYFYRHVYRNNDLDDTMFVRSHRGGKDARFSLSCFGEDEASPKSLVMAIGRKEGFPPETENVEFQSVVSFGGNDKETITFSLEAEQEGQGIFIRDRPSHERFLKGIFAHEFFRVEWPDAQRRAIGQDTMEMALPFLRQGTKPVFDFCGVVQP